MAIAEKAPRQEKAEPQYSELVQKPLAFMQDFLPHARAAQKRLFGESMTFEAGHATGLITHEFKEAKRRGVHTIYKVDTNSGKLDGSSNDLQKILNKNTLESLSGILMYKNPPKGLLSKLPKLGKYSGRDHKKIYIADDVAWVGGLNTSEQGFRNVDFMVKITNPKAVDALASLFENREHTKDYEIPTGDPETRILIDVGNRGKSLILDTVSKYVREGVESVHNMSMLKPDGKFNRALNEAAIEGSEVIILTSDPNEHKSDLSKTYQKLSRIIPNRSFYEIYEKGMIHAKLTIVDQKVAIFGSHNMSWQGVFLGTEEIAIITTNPELVAALEDFFQEELKKVLA